MRGGAGLSVRLVQISRSLALWIEVRWIGPRGPSSDPLPGGHLLPRGEKDLRNTANAGTGVIDRLDGLTLGQVQSREYCSRRRVPFASPDAAARALYFAAQSPAGAVDSPTSFNVRIPGGAARTSKTAFTAGIAVIVSQS